jgi:hypothetical protein
VLFLAVALLLISYWPEQSLMRSAEEKSEFDEEKSESIQESQH